MTKATGMETLGFDVDAALLRTPTPLAVVEVPSAHLSGANAAFVTLLRLDSSRLAALDLFSFLAVDERPLMAAVLAGVASGRTVSYQGRSRWRRGDDEAVDVLIALQALESGGPPSRAFLAAVPGHATDQLPSVPGLGGGDTEGVAERATRLEGHLWRVALEIQASGIGATQPGALRLTDPQLQGLSPRQAEVLRRLLRGERVSAIADALFLSPSTVRNHLSTIYRQLGVHSQVELLARLLPTD